MNSGAAAATRTRTNSFPVVVGRTAAIIAAISSVFVPAGWQVAIPSISTATILGALGPRVLLGFVLIFAGVSLGFATGYDPTLLGEAGGASLDGLRILVVLAAFGIIIVRDRAMLDGLKRAVPYLVFVGYAILSLVWSPARGIGLRSAAKLLYPIVGFLIVYRLGLTGQLAWIKRLVLMGALVGTLSNFLVRLAGLSGFESFEGRYFGAWHPNLMGMFCVATAVPLLAWGLERRSYLYVGTVILMLAQLALTGSRTMFLAGSAALAVVIVLRRKFMILMLLTLVAVGTWILLPSLGSRSESINSEDAGLAPAGIGPIQNFSGRLILWADVWTALVPGAEGIGRGLGATAAYLQARYLVGKHAHNTYLEVLADLGGVGLFLFVIAMLDMVRRCIRANTEAGPQGSGTRQAFLGLATAMLVGATMENTIAPAVEFTSVLWVLYAMFLVEGATSPAHEHVSA